MAKKQTRQTADVEVLPAVDDAALEPVHSDGRLVLGFLGNLTSFFRDATALETKAKDMLAEAKRFTVPAVDDIDGDAALQTFIKSASSVKKEVETHWGITSTIHGLHRKLTGARDRAVSPLTEAQNLAQQHHNAFAERARRIAAEEQRRINREAELAAQRERDEELARMEAAAIAAEEQSETLSDRELRFVELVYRGSAPYAAAKTVGYKTPETVASRLMESAKVKAALEGKRQAEAIREQATAVRETPVQATAQRVTTQVARVGSDRVTHSAEVVDARLLIEAVIGGKHGIPVDVLKVDEVKLNEYARSMEGLIDRWPGARYKRTVRTV